MSRFFHTFSRPALHLNAQRTALRCAALAAALTLFAGWPAGPAHAQAADACPPVAQAPTPEQLRTGQRDARDRGFLWRITKDGRSSWLYGTLHIARMDWMFPGPRVREALQASDTIALEIDVLDPEMQRRMAQATRAMPGHPLPAALRDRLDRQLQAQCLPPQALAGMAPEMQIAALGTLLGRRDGLDPGYGIDAVLAGWGRAAQQTVVSLESPESQLQAMQLGSPAETAALVGHSLDDIDSGVAQASLRRIAAMWAGADRAALERFESWCECVRTPVERRLMTRLLDERNPALAERVDAQHAAGRRVFAAVGSLHMAGPTGLPALLAARGYRIEPIAYDNKPQETRP